MKKIKIKLTVLNLAIAIINISIILAFAKPIAILLGISLIIAFMVLVSFKRACKRLTGGICCY